MKTLAALAISSAVLSAVVSSARPAEPAPRELVFAPSTDDWHPRYAPEGDKIAFSQLTPNGGQHIWVMNADGTGAKRLGPAVEPNWRPR